MRFAQARTNFGSSTGTLPSRVIVGAFVAVGVGLSILAGYGVVIDPGLSLAAVVAPVCLWLFGSGIRSRSVFPFILVFVLGFEQFTITENNAVLTFSKVAGILLFVVYCFSRSEVNRPLIASLRQIPLQFVLQLALVLWFAVTTLWSVRTDSAAVAISTYILLLILTWLIADFVQSPEDIDRCTNAIIAYGLVLAVFAIWQYQGSLDTNLYIGSNFRAESINDNPNIAAKYMVLALGILLGKLVFQRNWLTLLAGVIGAVALLLGISATASRGGAIAAAVAATAAVAFVLYRFGIWRTIKYVMLLGILAAFIYVVFPQYWAFLDRRFSGDGADITGYRTELIAVAIHYFWEHPFLGIGLESFRYYDVGLARLPSHNTYVGVLAETGLVGFGIFISILLVAFNNLRTAIHLTVQHKNLQLNPAASAGLLVGLIGFCGAIFFGDNADNKLFWLVLALIQMATLAVRHVVITAATQSLADADSSSNTQELL